MNTSTISYNVYRPIEHDCAKCKHAKLDGEGHVFCTAIGEWGDLSESIGWCKFFRENKHKLKRARKNNAVL
jgi:hypothetical protein